MNRNSFFGLLAIFALSLAALVRPSAAQSGDTGPIVLFNGWNISSIASGAVVTGTSGLKTNYPGSEIRIAVQCGSSVVLGIQETDGTNTTTSLLNGGTALNAGCGYGFTWAATNTTDVKGNPPATTPAAKAITFSFVIQGGASTVPILRVAELPPAVN